MALSDDDGRAAVRRARPGSGAASAGGSSTSPRTRRPGRPRAILLRRSTAARAGSTSGTGFAPIAFGDGSGNVERQPDVRYAWRPGVVTGRRPPSADAHRPLARRHADRGVHRGDGPPLVLVHGAAADHTTFRVVGPLLAPTLHGPRHRPARPRRVRRHAALRHRARVRGRGRGRRGARARDAGGARRRLRALVRRALRPRRGAADRRHRGGWSSYEGAPTPPGERYGDAALADELAALADAGRQRRRCSRRSCPRRRHDAPTTGRATAPTRSGRAASRPPRRSRASSPSRRRRRRRARAPGARPPAGAPGPRRRQPAEFGDATAALDDRLADGTDRRHPGRAARRPPHPSRRVRRRPSTSFLRRRARRPCDTPAMLDLGHRRLDRRRLHRRRHLRRPRRRPDGPRLPPQHRRRHHRRRHRRLAGAASWASARSTGFIAAIVVAVLGSLVVRLVLNAIDGH